MSYIVITSQTKHRFVYNNTFTLMDFADNVAVSISRLSTHSIAQSVWSQERCGLCAYEKIIDMCVVERLAGALLSMRCVRYPASAFSGPRTNTRILCSKIYKYFFYGLIWKFVCSVDFVLNPCDADATSLPSLTSSLGASSSLEWMPTTKAHGWLCVGRITLSLHFYFQ